MSKYQKIGSEKRYTSMFYGYFFDQEESFLCGFSTPLPFCRMGVKTRRDEGDRGHKFLSDHSP